MKNLYNVKLGILCDMNKEEVGNLKRIAKQEEINIWASSEANAIKLFIQRLIIDEDVKEEDIIFISCKEVESIKA